jgi:phosphoenolpyruvate synthase/pyruvate phosphate dikinase
LSQKILKLQKEIKNTKLGKEYGELFQAMRDGMHLKELRKSIVSQSLYYYDPILKEIARRGVVTLRQARFLKTDEIEDMLKNKKDYSKILAERLKLSVYIIEEGRKTKVLSGKRAEKIFNSLNKIPENIKEIRGLAASHGKARGPVKIVLSPSECKKVERGDVIVSGQVVPSFSSAIAIASAIIADGGTGITSHPATLAREAGIPCVIGARIATKVLKDGQMVEVDGDRGIIKVLK